MAITSAGYDETVTETSWAGLSQVLGSTAGVRGSGDLAVSGVAGVRTVQVAAGTAHGWGIQDVLDAAETVTLTANTGSVTRYDTIALQRDWGTNTTSVVAVAGGSTAALAALTVTPGVLTQQPLGIVPVAAGATSLDGVTVVDYRARAPRLCVSAQAPTNPVHHQAWLRPSGELCVWDASTGVWRLGAPFGEASLATYTWAVNGFQYRGQLSAVDVRDGVTVSSSSVAVPRDGVYRCEATVRFSGVSNSSTASVWVMLRRNSGGSPTGGSAVRTAWGTVDPHLNNAVVAERTVPMSAGDTVEVFLQSSLAGVQAVGGNSVYSSLSVSLVRGV